MGVAHHLFAITAGLLWTSRGLALRLRESYVDRIAILAMRETKVAVAPGVALPVPGETSISMPDGAKLR
jgi:hypothetical protein